MFDTRIEIRKCSEKRDTNNERIDDLDKVGFFYAQRTENGGRENLFASRIVHENEVIFTIRYTPQIVAGMFAVYNEQIMPIVSVHEEGRHKLIHLKCTKSDANDQD